MRDEDTKLREINLRDLTRRYRDDSLAVQALPLLSNTPDPALRHLLRDHRFSGIYDALEIGQRDAVDELLTFYGRIEIASIVEFVPDPLPDDFQEVATTHLSLPAVQQYYRYYYPLVLPRLLLRRLKGHPVESRIDRSVGNALFLEFMDTVSLIEGDPEVGRFLWFLDGGWSNDCSLKDVLAVLNDHESFLSALVSPEEVGSTPTPVTQAVRGLREYLLFCSHFDSLLRRAAVYPVLQGAFWYDQAYWFIHLRDKVGDTLRHAVDAIAAWGAGDTEESEGLPELHDAIIRLISGQYGMGLKDIGVAAVSRSRTNSTERGVSIHIGVNHPIGIHDSLETSENTAWKLAELSFQAGYRAIHVLRGAEATREAVGALLADVGRTLQPGHTLFVSFSGHGARVRNGEGDEPDAFDETWCLYDADLLDDELGEFWRRLPRGARALVVTDCCLAAGSIRKGYEPMAWSRTRPYAEDDLRFRGVKQFQVPLDLVTAPTNDDGLGASVLLLAAASKQQKAQEGLYVEQLLDVWAGGVFRGSFSELHEEVRRRVMGATHDQEPQLLMLGAPDDRFPLQMAFHLDRPVMRGGPGRF